MIKKIKAYLLKWLAPDYEQIKEQNKELWDDIEILVTKNNATGKDEVEYFTTYVMYRSQFDNEKMMMFGNTKQKDSFQGLIP